MNTYAMRLTAITATVFCLFASACGESSSPRALPPAPKPPAIGKIGQAAKSYTGSGPKVAILGDSLTALEWNDLYDSLDRDHAVEIGAWYGEGYNAGKFSEGLGAALLPATAKGFATSHPAVVVLAIGTNDALYRRSTPQALAAMQTMVAEFRGACMVGVTLPEHSGVKGWSNAEAHTLNVAMRKWADQVVDWASMSTGAGILQADGIHTTAKGTKLRANAIVAAVERCPAR